jgi:Na+/glutamate symporter
MGVTWAIGWMIAALVIGLTSLWFPGVPFGWFFQSFDAPLPAMAIPGFFAGVFFSIVLGTAARKRTFHELSLRRFALWGAFGGVLLTLFPFALSAVGLATVNTPVTPLLLSFGGPFMLLGAVSAVVTLKVARRAEARAPGLPPRQSALLHSDENGVFGVDELNDHRSRVL